MDDDNNAMTIRKYLTEDSRLGGQNLEDNLKRFSRNPDIAQEFIKWIEDGANNDNFPNAGLRIADYSAADIKALAPFMNGLGVYNFLITLREKPEFARQCIADGFPLM